MTALLLVYFALLVWVAKDIQAKVMISMGDMAEISEKNGREMEKKFSDLEKLISADPDKKVFNIKPADNAHIQFSFQPSKGNKPSSDKKKKEPEYFLNFVFNNYRNPKKSLDRKTLSKKVKMRRTARRLLPNGIPNPYKYFPLKGDDM